MISDRSRKFFFLIDGLDEFDWEPKEIIDLVISATQPNVKLCLASRPWLPFEDAFKNIPSFLLERFTRPDIETYVKSHFHDNEHYLRLHLDEPAAAIALLQHFVTKAQGVFLWVYLVTQSLLEGLSSSDKISDLQARLNALPSDMQALFNKLLDRLQPQYFKQACESFRLLRAYHNMFSELDSDNRPTLLGLYFADDQDTKSSVQAPENVPELSHKAKLMRRRLNARCKGFIEVIQGRAEEPDDPTRLEIYDEVSYLHRTARDFVESEEYWPVVMQTTACENFKPEERRANAHLWLHKALHTQGTKGEPRFCIKGAFLVQQKTGLIQKTYLDELFHLDTWNYITDTIRGNLAHVVMPALINKPELSGYLALTLEAAGEDDLKLAFYGQDISVMSVRKEWRKHKEIAVLVKYYTAFPGTR
jgi:hypothetical protein